MLGREFKELAFKSRERVRVRHVSYVASSYVAASPHFRTGNRLRCKRQAKWARHKPPRELTLLAIAYHL